NGWLLPAGPLRESPRRRRDVTVINAPELAPALVAQVAPAGSLVVQMTLEGGVAERMVARGERLPLATLAAS
ncbi:MAG: tetraacyldisaccharide 4'-kinase, partial [Janthinobacterium sp.]